MDSLVCCPKELFEPNPRPLDFCHAIPFAYRQPKLDRPVNNYVRCVQSLVLVVRHSGDVAKLKKFFKGGQYGHHEVLGIVDNLLDNFFALEELVGDQLTAVILELSQHVRDGVVDRIGCEVEDIHKVIFLDCGNKFMHKSLLHSRHFL